MGAWLAVGWADWWRGARECMGARVELTCRRCGDGWMEGHGMWERCSTNGELG